SSAVAVLLLGLVLAGVASNYKGVDRSGDYAARRTLENVSHLPPNAIVYDTENTTSLQYFVYVEHRRPDIRIRQVRVPNVRQTLQRDMGAGRTVYFLRPSYRTLLEQEYELKPEGGLWRAVPLAGERRGRS
ncbi:MAG: hypothetical protein M3281_09465, partial [Chloroflexota bacterium]|nr:hypothetical protein [Chloroflexota bacterium]